MNPFRLPFHPRNQQAARDVCVLRRLVRVRRANLIQTLVQFSGERDVGLSGNLVSGHNSDCRLRQRSAPDPIRRYALMDGSAFPTGNENTRRRCGT